MNRSVYGPRAGATTCVRRYWQIASKKFAGPVGTMESTLVHGDVHAGVLGAQLGEQLWQQPSRRGADDPQPGVAADLVAAAGHLGGDVVELVQHPPRSFDHHEAFVGETATLAIDQGDTELAFQAGDVAADVGLHRVQGPGGCRERAMVGNRYQGGELP